MKEQPPLRGTLLSGCVVDDFFVFYNRPGKSLRDRVWKAFVSKVRKITNLGPISWIIQVHVSYDRERGVLTFNQGNFVRHVLSRFGMTDCAGSDTPGVSRCHY